jgi:hypothetical protein
MILPPKPPRCAECNTSSIGTSRLRIRSPKATGWPSATHTGSLQGMPPTGKPVRVTGVNVARFAEGKIAESWFNFDMLTLLQQVGAIPTP